MQPPSTGPGAHLQPSPDPCPLLSAPPSTSQQPTPMTHTSPTARATRRHDRTAACSRPTSTRSSPPSTPPPPRAAASSGFAENATTGAAPPDQAFGLAQCLDSSAQAMAAKCPGQEERHAHLRRLPAPPHQRELLRRRRHVGGGLDEEPAERDAAGGFQAAARRADGKPRGEGGVRVTRQPFRGAKQTSASH
ncbi:unnamed protein product [Urochloa humidicola]